MSDHVCCPGCLECMYTYSMYPEYCCHKGFMLAWFKGEQDFIGIMNDEIGHE